LSFSASFHEEELAGQKGLAPNPFFSISFLSLQDAPSGGTDPSNLPSPFVHVVFTPGVIFPIFLFFSIYFRLVITPGAIRPGSFFDRLLSLLRVS